MPDLLFFVGEGLAVFFDFALDAVGIDVEDFVLFAFGLFDGASGVEFLSGGEGPVGVVFADLLEFFLVSADLEHELTDVGDRVGG